MNEQTAHGRLPEAAGVIVIFVLLATAGLSVRPLRWPAWAASSEQTKAEATGFYCNLKALSTQGRARHKGLTQKLKLATLETKELSDGFGFRLDKARISVPETAEWISVERECCPFFDFEMELQKDGGPLWLKLSGREGGSESVYAAGISHSVEVQPRISRHSQQCL